MNQRRKDRPFQFSLLALFVVVSITCFIFARPAIAMMCGASLATLMLGLACVRAALVNRISGWISGLMFGSVFLVIGTLACILSFSKLIRSLVTGF